MLHLHTDEEPAQPQLLTMQLPTQMEDGKLQEQPAEQQVMSQQPDSALVQHLQHRSPVADETILQPIQDLHLKDLHTRDLQAAVSDQHSQEPPVPTRQVPGHSPHIQDRQAVLPVGRIRVLQVKVPRQDLHQHLHIPGQVQTDQIATHAQAALETAIRDQAQAEVTPVQAVRVQAEAIQVRANPVPAAVIQDQAVQDQAEATLHQAAQAAQVQAGVTLHQAAQAAPVQAGVIQEVVQVQVVPAPARVQVVQGQAVAEGKKKTNLLNT